MNLYRKLSRNYLFRNAGITATLSGAGAVSGLILDALIVSAFGVGYQTDAYFTALPLRLLLSVVFSIQCPKVLIPVFSEYFNRNEHADAWMLLRNVVTTCFLVFAGIWLAGIVLSRLIIPLQIPGLESRTISLAIWLSRILFGLVLCQGLASIMQSVLYARHSYFISCSGKLVSNVVTIIFLVSSRGHFGIQAVAVGMLFGNAVQVGLLALVLATHGFRYHWLLKPTA